MKTIKERKEKKSFKDQGGKELLISERKKIFVPLVVNTL